MLQSADWVSHDHAHLAVAATRPHSLIDVLWPQLDKSDLNYSLTSHMLIILTEAQRTMHAPYSCNHLEKKNGTCYFSGTES